jgi:hypothetical protein
MSISFGMGFLQERLFGVKQPRQIRLRHCGC